MGAPGGLVLDAKRQQKILLDRNTSDEVKRQTLFLNQGAPSAALVGAQNGPWNVLIPGVAYSRFKVVEGNLGMNTLELRILPQITRAAATSFQATFMTVAQRGAPVQTATTTAAGALSLFSLLNVRFAPLLAGGSAASTGTVGGVLAEAGTVALALPVLYAVIGIGGIYYPEVAAQALIGVLAMSPQLREDLVRALTAMALLGAAGSTNGSDRCREEWGRARDYCADLFSLPPSQRPPGPWGGSYEKCVLGQVTQFCGGNRVVPGEAR
jgi:hypothetical protein